MWTCSGTFGNRKGYDGLFEQSLRELGQVDAPVAPDVASVGLDIFVGIALLVKVFAIHLVVVVEEVVLADGYPVEGWFLLELGLQHTLRLRCEATAFGFEVCPVLHIQMDVGREESDIVEPVRIEARDGEAVTSTHRESADCTLLLVGKGAIVLVHIAHNVLERLFRGCYRLGGRVSHERRLVHALVPLARCSIAIGIAVGHDYYHGFHLTLGNEVVQYLGRLVPRWSKPPRRHLHHEADKAPDSVCRSRILLVCRPSCGVWSSALATDTTPC